MFLPETTQSVEVVVGSEALLLDRSVTTLTKAIAYGGDDDNEEGGGDGKYCCKGTSTALGAGESLS